MSPCECSVPCDRQALPNEKYCILHSQNPEKDQATFENALRAHRNQNASDSRYIVFLPSFCSMRGHFNSSSWGHPVDFSNAIFLAQADFNEFNFGGGVTFHNTVFRRGVQSVNTTFHRADFTLARFEDDASFRHARFSGGATFIDTVFEGGCDFLSTVGGARTTFDDGSVFLRTKFLKGATFQETFFDKPTEFIKAEFSEPAIFSMASFRGETNFDSVRFHKDAAFVRAKLENIATFRGARNEPVFFGKADFRSVLLDRSNMLRFVDVDCSRGCFRGSDVKLMEFDGVEWCRVTVTRRGLYEETLLVETNDPLSITDVEKLYRALKQNYEERRDIARAGDFHFGEKQMRLRNPRTPKSLQVLLALSKLTSGYGESYLRPLCWFLGLLTYASLLGLMDGFVDKDTKRYLSLWSLSDWTIAIGFVFAKAIHLDREGDWLSVTGVAKAISLSAGVLGPIFGALLVLGIRNRLKR